MTDAWRVRGIYTLADYMLGYFFLVMPATLFLLTFALPLVGLFLLTLVTKNVNPFHYYLLLCTPSIPIVILFATTAVGFSTFQKDQRNGKVQMEYFITPTDLVVTKNTLENAYRWGLMELPQRHDGFIFVTSRETNPKTVFLILERHFNSAHDATTFFEQLQRCIVPFHPELTQSQ